MKVMGDEAYADRTRYGGISTEPDFAELHAGYLYLLLKRVSVHRFDLRDFLV